MNGQNAVSSTDGFYVLAGKTMFIKSKLLIANRVIVKHVNTLDERSHYKKLKTEDQTELAKNTISGGGASSVLKDNLEKNGITYNSKDKKQALISVIWCHHFIFRNFALFIFKS